MCQSSGIISVNCLFCRAPRFKGYQQQDSHELLRYLMDGMKAEEIKVKHPDWVKKILLLVLIELDLYWNYYTIANVW